MKNDYLQLKRYIKTIPRYENYEYEEEKKKYDRKCKYCGWTNRVLSKNKRVPCKNFGRYVFLTPKDEFIYKMKKVIK